MVSDIVAYGNQRIITIAETGEVYQLYSSSDGLKAYITSPETGKKQGTIKKHEKLSNVKNKTRKARNHAAEAKKNKTDKAKAKEHLKEAENLYSEAEKDIEIYPFDETLKAMVEAYEAAKKAQESADEAFDDAVDDADAKAEDAANKTDESAEQSFTVYDDNDKELYNLYSVTVPETKKEDSAKYLDLKNNKVYDADGNELAMFSDEQPGPGSEELNFIDPYTYRQLVGLNDVLADMCQDIKMSSGNDFSSVTNAPDNVDTKSGKSASFTTQGTEYHLVKDTENSRKIHLLKRTATGFEYVRTYEIVVDGSGKVRVNEFTWVYSDAEKDWHASNLQTSKYVLSKVTRSDGKLSYWEIFKIGAASAFAALTPPLPLTSKYEDCEERLDRLYNKNNKKTSTTKAESVEASEPTKWNWPSAQVTFSSMSSSGTGVVSSNATTSSSSSSNSSWSWVNTSATEKLAGVNKFNKANKNNNKSASNSNSFTTKAKNALGAISELGKKMVSFFNKDAKTAKGEELNKEEPLSVPDMSKETQALAVATTGVPPLVAKGARDAVLISTAIERQKVAYGKGRQSYQQEHQSATEIRKTRLQYRQTNIAYCLNTGIGSSGNSGTA